MGERRDWTLCAWCWRPLGDDPYYHRGMPHCDERCAGHEVPADQDADVVVPVSDDQLVME